MTRSPDARFAYSPALDGFRGLAILLVVPFNFHWAYPRGGFLGVDVFFVLSGFLITSLLLTEYDRIGSIRIGAFYARRALRLLPALVVLLGAMVGYALLFGSRNVFQETLTGALYTFFYVGNLVISFGGPDGWRAMASFGHTWSLSVEEQFYLVFPVLLLLLLGVRLGKPRIALVLGAIALASAVWRSYLWFHGSTGTRLYGGTDTRLDGPLIGCVLALLVYTGAFRDLSRHTLGALALAGGITLLALVSTMHPDLPFMYAGGGYTVAALSAAAVLMYLALRPDSAVARAFSTRWLVWLGRVSYGIYLWHYPIASIVDVDELAGIAPPVVVQLARVIATLAAAVASYYIVERPFLRLKGRFSAAGTEHAPAPSVPRPVGQPELTG